MGLETSKVPLRGVDHGAFIDTSLTPQTAFTHRLCQAWSAWSYGGGRLGCTTYARLFGLPVPPEDVKGVIYLSEEQLLAIDAGIARLDRSANAIINVHYRSSENEPMYVRYARLCVTRTEYRERRMAALAMLYQELMPAVERWQHFAL
jgi:hypothetical protein